MAVSAVNTCGITCSVTLIRLEIFNGMDIPAAVEMAFSTIYRIIVLLPYACDHPRIIRASAAIIAMARQAECRVRESECRLGKSGVVYPAGVMAPDTAWI